MADLIHQLISQQARCRPLSTAVIFKELELSYADLLDQVNAVASGLLERGIQAGERVAVYLPKQPEVVYSLFGASVAGASFVPVNPLLKPRQVAYILRHCNVRVLITSSQRLKSLVEAISQCPELHTIILTEDAAVDPPPPLPDILSWPDFLSKATAGSPHRRIDTDMAAILYTSGSTGNPKGVVLSHRNIVAGAHSVTSYLENTSEDRILAVLPLSFDAGLSQLTTAFSVGATVVLMDYLLPRDVIRAVVRYNITGLAAVPPLWNQLVSLPWPDEAVSSLRYITNTGGAMPVPTTRGLSEALPETDIFLMYGLTEAFRSTYLPPGQVEKRPDSIGKAIPNAEILVMDEDGKECPPGVPGELVHRGSLVALGYWNDPEKTAERFRPSPKRAPEIPTTELAVWSGDQVVRDEQGYLYFVSRKDDMIKTSGYRVSPTEIEEVAYASGMVAGAVALGLPHAILGQAIALIASHQEGVADLPEVREKLLTFCRTELPSFMIPLEVVLRDSLPHNQNGKLDRRALAEEYRALFSEITT